MRTYRGAGEVRHADEEGGEQVPHAAAAAGGTEAVAPRVVAQAVLVRMELKP